LTAGATKMAPEETVTHAVRCAGLSYLFGTHTAVDHVDLSIEPGEMFGLLGPNGAGKTTTVEILEGFRPRTDGEVTVLGVDPAAAGSAWRDAKLTNWARRVKKNASPPTKSASARSRASVAKAALISPLVLA